MPHSTYRFLSAQSFRLSMLSGHVDHLIASGDKCWYGPVQSYPVIASSSCNCLRLGSAYGLKLKARKGSVYRRCGLPAAQLKGFRVPALTLSRQNAKRGDICSSVHLVEKRRGKICCVCMLNCDKLRFSI